jgi:hypothetical protein
VLENPQENEKNHECAGNDQSKKENAAGVQVLA